MTLYLKYRPQKLEELDSEEVRESLKKIVSKKDIPHAFLFAGPKGTGKTSAARIIAKILNCERIAYSEKRKVEPCNNCDSCLSITKGNSVDVVEIDAASHGLVDDIRALRDVAKLSPAKAKKKIYIIDEAHMLSAAGSNALLKILEEPPSHVVFILATTNPEKLIGTIRSRTTEIIFKKAQNSEIERSLGRAIKGEKIKIDKETLAVIAKLANGSFRDAIKALEQFSLEGPAFLKKNAAPEVQEFTEFLFKKDLEALLADIKKRVNAGFLVGDFIKEILFGLQERLVSGEGNRSELIELIELMINASKQISNSPIEELPLEVAVVKWCQAEPDPTPQDGERKEVVKINGENMDEGVWKSILSAVRPVNASIEALLRAAKPMGFDGKTLTLGVFYKFHKERLEEGAHRRILEDVITDVLGNPVRVVCTLTNPPIPTSLTESKDEDIIKAAEEIFGV